MGVSSDQILDLVRQYHADRMVQATPFTPGDRIPYAGRVFDDEELVSLVDSALDFWLTAGRYTKQFERGLAAYLGTRHCSLVNSGSSANLLAFVALTSPLLNERRILPGDEVIAVAAAFPTTVGPILQAGTVPVFIDVTIPSYNADVSQLEAARSSRTKAVFLAHTLGNPFDIASVKAFCERHELWLIEDNCDALGSRYCFDGEWGLTGTFGHLGTSSFYPPHHITMGEGGAVYTESAELKRIVNSFRDWGRDCWCEPGRDGSCGRRFTKQFESLPFGYDHKYVYSHLGYNLKATDMQAAIGVAQLAKLDSFVEARKANWNTLSDDLSALQDRFILPHSDLGSDPSWFGFMLTVRENAPFTRNEIVKHLEEHGVQTRMLFAGNLTRHPCFASLAPDKDYRIATDLRNTDKIMKSSFWIGVYPGLKQDQLAYMTSTIKDFAS